MLKKLQQLAAYFALFGVPLLFWGAVMYSLDFVIHPRAANAVERQLGSDWASFRKNDIVTINDQPHLILGAFISPLRNSLTLTVQDKPGTPYYGPNRKSIRIDWLKHQQIQLVRQQDEGYSETAISFLQ